MEGICRLYKTKGTIRISHIAPKFAVKRLKSTGVNYIRFIGNLNKREQDGLKKKLLSPKAEELFSKKEKWFNENIFKPFLDYDRQVINYDSSLYYFSISYLWRSLLVSLEDSKIINTIFYPKLVELEDTWRQFLIDSVGSLNTQIHLYFTQPTDRYRSSSSNYINTNGLDYYLNRAFDHTIVFRNDGSYVAVYGKFLQFTFWGIIVGDVDSPDTQIYPYGGEILTNQVLEDKTILEWFTHRSEEIYKILSTHEYSKGDLKQIKQNLLKIPNRLENPAIKYMLKNKGSTPFSVDKYGVLR